jgi:hypothetical protein
MTKPDRNAAHVVKLLHDYYDVPEAPNFAMLAFNLGWMIGELIEASEISLDEAAAFTDWLFSSGRDIVDLAAILERIWP